VMYAYLTGPEQAAVEMIAHTLGMMAFSDGSLTQAMSVTVRGSYAGPHIWWCNSAAALAAERNLKVPWLSFGSVGDPQWALWDDHWYKMAVACISACISGMEGMWLAGGSTGPEARWAGEIARAAAEIKVSDGVAIVKEIMKRPKASKPAPVPLSDLYDMKTLRPRKELIDQYRKFTKLFREMGLRYPTWD
jgi:hypothetical protein